MEQQKETRFSRVYNDLKDRIVSGQFRAGDNFLSLSQLRQEYQIGFRTAKEVTARLREQGYIESRNRRAPVICQTGGASACSAVSEVLSRKSGLPELYESLSVIIPPILAFASHSCDFYLLPHYEQLKKAAVRGIKPQNWRLVPRICREIINAHGNPLFSEVYARFHRYSHLPFFMEADNSPLKDMLANTKEYLSVLMSRDYAEIYSMLTVSLQSTAFAVEDMLDSIKKQFQSMGLPEEKQFEWTGLYERDPVYIQILQDIIIKITTGIYPPGQYLPHEKELAGQYGAALSTVRKSLAELRQLGYCRTLNVKGSIAQKRPVEAARRTVKNPSRRKDAMRYLYGLQFMSLIAGPAAQRAAPMFTAKDLTRLEAEIEKSNACPFAALADSIIQNLDLKPLRAVFEETERLVRWGYCAFFSENYAEKTRQMKLSAKSALKALKAGDTNAFAEEIANCYRDSLYNIRAQFIQTYQMKEAECIAIPLSERS